MSADPKRDVTKLPTVGMPEFLKSNPIEEDIANIQFSDRTKLAKPEAPAAEDRAQEPTSSVSDLSLRTGEVMKALFPDGLHLKSDTDFALFRAFDRMIRNVTYFAHSGMRAEDPLHKVSSDAVLLASMLSKKGKS